MSIVKMKRMTLIGLESERKPTVDALAQLGCVHLDRTECENTANTIDEQGKDDLQRKMSAVDDCLSFIKLCEEQRASFAADKKEAKARNPYKGFKIDMAFDDFASVRKEEIKLFDEVIDKVNANSKIYYENQTKAQKLTALAEELKPYSEMDVAFSQIKDTEHTSSFLGTLPLDAEQVSKLFEEIDAEVQIVYSDKTSCIIYAVCLKEDRANLADALSKAGFVRCQFNFDITATQKSNESIREIEEIKEANKKLVLETCGFYQYVKDLKLLYDYYDISLQKTQAEGNLGKTQKTFTLEAWVPFDREEEITSKLDGILSAKMLEFRDPTDDENPPTLTKNNKIVEPYDCITNMYSVPNYRERDPNSFVAVFYFLFFGIMLGDAGYGLILTVGALLFAKIMKPNTGTRKLIFVLAMGGVRTIFWGIMFGGWFAITTDVPLLQPILFSPLDNPIGMVALSLALGAVQICTGMTLNGIAKCEKGKVLDGILDDFLWVLFFLFGGLAAVGMALVPSLVNVGLYGALGCLVIVFLTAGRHKKGAVGKVLGGFGGLYKIVGFVSDLLSYLRLFGLGLASGVIGLVFNEIANIFTGPIGLIFAVIVLIVGHSLNIAINVLGAYVHDSRLQFIEFFSRFYTGEGYLFQPIVGETKYTKINN